MSNFKLGSKVIDFQFGYGEVVHIMEGPFPIEVQFITGNIGRFTTGGLQGWGAKFPTLFLADDYPAEYPQHEKPRPDLKVDDKVLVGDFKPTHKRYFAYWGGDGRICTWRDGRTSWTCDEDDVSSWKHYKVATDE